MPQIAGTSGAKQKSRLAGAWMVVVIAPVDGKPQGGIGTGHKVSSGLGSQNTGTGHVCTWQAGDLPGPQCCHVYTENLRVSA